MSNDPRIGARNEAISLSGHVHRALLAASALSVMFSPVVTRAADAPNSSGTLAEIVVTATKREESVISVPVSISVVSAEDIDRKGIKDLEDLSRSVPSLVVVNQGEVQPKTLIIRGIGPSEHTASTVAVYVDDTPLTVAQNSPDLKLFDFDRVEVLRGPQGTLFGSSAMGGAIRYITPQPGYNGVTGMAKLETGSIDGGGANYEAQGAIGGPIVDGSVAYRASGFYRRDGGYVDLVDEDTTKVIAKDINWVESYGGRFALGIRPSESLEATLSVLYQGRHQNNFSESFSALGVLTAVPLQPDQRAQRTPPDYSDHVYLPNLTIKARFGGGELTSSTSYLDEHVDVNNDFSYFLHGLFTENFGEPEAVGRPLVSLDEHRRGYEAFSEELRYASQQGGKVEWLAGAYYRHTRALDFQSDSSQNIGIVYPFIDGLQLPGGVVYERNGVATTEQIAGFGELTFKFTPALKLTGGLRYTSLKLAVNEDANGVFNGGFTTTQTSSSERPVTPKLSLSYEPSANTLLYLTAAKGFREGGPNDAVPAGIAACAAALAALGLTQSPLSYNSDRLVSYELGAKLLTPDRRFRFQGAVYQINWDEIQENINLGGNCGASYVDNVGKARVRGVEAELAWYATHDLSFDLTAGYSDGKLVEDLILGADENGPIVAAPSGTTLPGIPKETATLSVEYDFAVGAQSSGYVRVEDQYIGSSKRDLNTPNDDPRVLDQSSHSILLARVALMTNGYEFTLFGDNLLNDRTVLGLGTHSYAPWAGYAMSTVRPRIIGISVTKKFK